MEQSESFVRTDPVPKEFPHQHSREYSAPKYVYAEHACAQDAMVLVSFGKNAPERALPLVASV